MEYTRWGNAMKCKGALLYCPGCNMDYYRGETDPDGTCGLCGYNRARMFPGISERKRRKDRRKDTP